MEHARILDDLCYEKKDNTIEFIEPFSISFLLRSL